MRNGSIVTPHLLALALVAVGFLSGDRAFPKDGPVQTKFKTVAQSLIVVPVRVSGAGPYEFLLDTGPVEPSSTRNLPSQAHFRAWAKMLLQDSSGRPRSRSSTLFIFCRAGQRYHEVPGVLRPA